MRWVRAVAMASALMVNTGVLGGLAGCSSTAAPQQGSPQHASIVVGAQGGSVTTSDGSGVSLPAGAVSSDVTITVDSTPGAATPSQGVAVGTPYTFGPEGEQFSVPVTVTLAFDPSSLPSGKTAKDIVIFTAPAGTSNYVPLGTSVADATHAAAQTTHFSTFVCVIPSAPITEDSGPPSEDASAGPKDATISSDDGATAIDSSGGTPDTGTPDTGTGGHDATVDEDAGTASDATTTTDASHGGDDGAIVSGDATAAIESGAGDDASIPTEGGTPIDASAPTDATVASDASTGCSLSGPLSSAITPLQTIAGLNMNLNGVGTAPLTYAQSILCGPGIFGGQEDAGADPGTTIARWSNGDISAEYKDTNDLLYSVTVQGSYSGTLDFQSRAGGAFGDGHAYSIAIGHITKDGSPFVIGWNAPAAALNELSDGMMSTFAPGYPWPAGGDWLSLGAILQGPDDGSNPDGGVGNSYFGVRPLKFYVFMPGYTSTPSFMYTFFIGSASPTDAGVAGLTGNGGLTVPSGCSTQGGGTLLGSCEVPTGPFCSKYPGTAAVSCQDWPQSGYLAICCPVDGGSGDAAP